jgi:hypothetical protein
MAKGETTPMARAASWLAWGLWLIALVVAIPYQFLSAANPDADPVVINLIAVLVSMAYVTVGALIVSRRPGNTIGWLLLILAFLQVVAGLMIEYAVYGMVTRPGALPYAIWVGEFGGMARMVGFDLILFLLLLFPNGRLPSPRWRWFGWATALAILLANLAQTLGPDMSSISPELAPFTNPTSMLPPDLANALGAFTNFGLIFACFVGCCISVVVRYRRAGGMERQQIKWLAMAGVWATLGFLVVIVGAIINNSLLASSLTFSILLVGIPIAVGIAILRYRLFDIDVLINRALVYGLLTALLAALYFAGVAGAQALVNIFTHQPGGESPVIVVLTTLVIATLFMPLRSRIQTFIDHRFYRRKYDAALTLERFGETLRTDLDMSALTRHLVTVVDETMRPAHVSLWLRRDDQGPAR